MCEPQEIEKTSAIFKHHIGMFISCQSLIEVVEDMEGDKVESESDKV